MYHSPKEDFAFVQVYLAKQRKYIFHRVPYSEFKASTTCLDVEVGGSHFTSTSASIRVNDEEGTVEGDITLVPPFAPWPVTKTKYGAMGWTGRVPFLECYHGVLSFSHGLRGSLRVSLPATAGAPANAFVVNFDGGKGYLEKDWGTGFPKGYFWIQSNHFVSEQQDTIESTIAALAAEKAPMRASPSAPPVASASVDPEIPPSAASEPPAPSGGLAHRGTPGSSATGDVLAKLGHLKACPGLGPEFTPLGLQAMGLAPQPPSDAGLVMSVAVVPIPGLPNKFSAQGFFGGLHFGGRTIALGTYTWGAHLNMRPVSDGSGQTNNLVFTAESGRYRLSVAAHAPPDIAQQPRLKIPTAKGMEPLIHESLEGTIRVRLWEAVPAATHRQPTPETEQSTPDGMLDANRGKGLAIGGHLPVLDGSDKVIIKRWKLLFAGVGHNAGIEYFNTLSCFGVQLGTGDDQ
eukprot:GAFH01001415.1.p1 GENE.GAFH01001415.1~~GAFH01001415.1.p1  ORF type:complete len:538 (+),score=24.96 GAFH01001415.1:235-1614(+)